MLYGDRPQLGLTAPACRIGPTAALEALDSAGSPPPRSTPRVDSGVGRALIGFSPSLRLQRAHAAEGSVHRRNDLEKPRNPLVVLGSCNGPMWPVDEAYRHGRPVCGNPLALWPRPGAVPGIPAISGLRHHTALSCKSARFAGRLRSAVPTARSSLSSRPAGALVAARSRGRSHTAGTVLGPPPAPCRPRITPIAAAAKSSF